MPKAKGKTPAKSKAAKVVNEEPNMIDHVVSEEDLQANPELIEKGVVVGQTIQIPEDAVVGDDTEEPEEDEEAQEKVGELSVYKENGDFVRTYSAEIHGKGYKALAKEFASKIEGSVK
jgi:flagellar hook assembly protein FlgD